MGKTHPDKLSVRAVSASVARDPAGLARVRIRQRSDSDLVLAFWRDCCQELSTENRKLEATGQRHFARQKNPWSSPAKPYRDRHNYGLEVACAKVIVSDVMRVGPMVAPFHVKFGTMKTAQTTCQSAAVVEAPRNLAIRGHRLRRHDEVIEAAVKIPPCPRGLAGCAGCEWLAVGQRDAAIIETDAENSVCVPFAKVEWRVDDAIQTYRLHTSALVRQTLSPLHAGSKAEVVVHVFGIGPEHAAEVHAASKRGLKRISDIAGDLIASDTKAAAGGEVKTIEIRLCRNRCNEPAKGKQEQYPIPQSRSPVSQKTRS